VVQGPGCLNYSLVLPITCDGPFQSISIANQFIMRRNRAAIESAIGHSSPAVAIRGHTDLVIGERKFSGNSQRRHKTFLLFHGTFLLNFDLAWISDLLRMPSKQPAYRENRSHGEFLTNLNLPAEKVKAAMQESWGANSSLTNLPREKIAALVREKYATREWNFKF
jgi:lipoate-protein ligase A